jgi:hypothetical protein
VPNRPTRSAFPLACRVECLEVTAGGRESPWLRAHGWPGLDQLPVVRSVWIRPVPALDFAVQSELALKNKVSEGAGHDGDV